MTEGTTEATENQLKIVPADTAHYIQRMSRELKDMAHGANLGFLAYLLSMVEEEAGTVAKRMPGK